MNFSWKSCFMWYRPTRDYKEIFSNISKILKNKTEHIFWNDFSHRKNNIFILVFFCDLENTYTFIKTNS